MNNFWEFHNEKFGARHLLLLKKRIGWIAIQTFIVFKYKKAQSFFSRRRSATNTNNKFIKIPRRGETIVSSVNSNSDYSHSTEYE